MKCSNCNTENDKTSKFCFNCGSKLQEEPSVTETVPSQEEQPVVIEEPVQQVSTPVVEPVQVKNEKKKGKKSGIIFVAIILVLLVLAVCGVVIGLSTPANVYKTVLQKSTTLLSNTINDYDTSSIYLSITPKVELEEENEAIDVINKLSFAFSTKMNNTNKAFDYNAVIKYNNNELLNLIVTYKNSLYITLDELLSKSIKVEVDEFDEIFTKKEFNDDFQYVYKSFIKAFTSSLKNEYFTKDTETISINGKDVKATANTLNLNNENAKKILKDTKEKLLRDKKFISTLAKITEETEAEVKEEIEQLDDIDDMEETTGNIVIYTTGLTNKVVRVKLYAEEASFFITSLDDNKYELLFEAEGVKISFNLEYTYEYDKDVNISVPTNSISYEELDYTDILDALEKLENNKAYKELTEDLGVDLEDLMSSLMNSGYDYDYDYDYDYSY